MRLKNISHKFLWQRHFLRLCLVFLFLGFLFCAPPALICCRPASADSGQITDDSRLSLPDSYETFRAGDRSQQAFENLCRSVFLEEVQSDTVTLHYNLASPEGQGITDYEVTLGDYSRESFEKGYEAGQKYLSTLQDIPRESLTGEQQLTYDILEESLKRAEQLHEFYYYRESLGPTTGIQAQLPVLLAEYHFRSEQDIRDYLALCADVPRYFDQLLTFEQEKAEAGLFMSDAVLDQILNQCNHFCENPESSFMLTTFNQTTDSLSWLEEDTRFLYQEQNRRTVLSDIIPAYEKLSEGLKALRGSGRNDHGLCDLPQGTEYYRLLVRSATGSSRSVEELLELVSQRLVQDVRTMSQLYETSDDLDTQLKQTFSLSEPELILIDLKSKMRNDFPTLTAASCEVKYVPADLEEHLSPAFYLVPPLDHLTENCIYINRASTDRSRLYTTLAHEGYPGHLYQTVYSASCQSEPLRSLLNYKGYTEGWATYVERLAYRYEDSFSPELKEFLTCNASATLALYALCDMNIHLNGWGIPETGQFLRTWIHGLEDSAVEEIYDAILANPANYLSYHVGAMEFELLREEAEERLGDAFDLKEFHTFILETGACPFDVLRERMEEWMRVAAGA